MNVDENKQILQYAIEKANENLLAEEDFRLEAEVAEIEFGNEFNISRSICGILEVSLERKNHKGKITKKVMNNSEQ